MNHDPLTVNCPTCSQPVLWEEQSPYRPFCCKRCQLVDFGEWADEEKRIPSNNNITDNEHWSEISK